MQTKTKPAPTHHVTVLMPGKKRSYLLGSKGRLTTKRIHACQFTAEEAERVAKEIIAENPGVQAGSRKFA